MVPTTSGIVAQSRTRVQVVADERERQLLEAYERISSSRPISDMLRFAEDHGDRVATIEYRTSHGAKRPIDRIFALDESPPCCRRESTPTPRT